MSFRTILLSVAATSLLTVSGCTSDFQGYYLKNAFGFDSVCLVDNKNVPATFFISLRQALEDKGLKVVTVSSFKKAEAMMCPATVVYEAKYEQSPFPYLSQGKLMLIVKDGEAVVVEMNKADAKVPLLDQVGDSDPAIRSLVNRLLPRETPW